MGVTEGLLSMSLGQPEKYRVHAVGQSHVDETRLHAPNIGRRAFLAKSLLAAGAASLTSAGLNAQKSDTATPLRIAPFRFEVSPPLGHPLCGGWIKPVVGYDDALECIGYVLLGAGSPLVVCAVDWTGVLNEAHLQWRSALADAAGTTPDRVAVQAVHQHNAPFACPATERLLQTHSGQLRNLDLNFLQTCLDRGREAVRQALPLAQPVTHVAFSQAPVLQVASNRRVLRDGNGKVIRMRGSYSKDPELIALPEGLIDPDLRTLSFFNGNRRLVSCHYYATHPMSYYGDGRVTSDFVGLARKRRQADDPGCTQIYFTGCAGNVSAGKYNDGSPAIRPLLAERIYTALVASEGIQRPEPIASVEWRTQSVLLSPRPQFNRAELQTTLANSAASPADRIRSAMKLIWMERCAEQIPLVISALRINRMVSLHLPAEMFVDYQLRIQKLAPSLQIATAAYGDGGPWYIPTAQEFPSGGYEVDYAFCGPEVDTILSATFRPLLS